GTGISLVLAGVFRGGAVGGFEHGGLVADVGAGSQADASGHGGGRIGGVIAVQVRRGGDAVFVWAKLDLLGHAVGNAVLDEDLVLGLFAAAGPHFVFRDDLVAKLGLGQLIAPVLEGALGEFHDVALVHQRHAGQLLGDGVLDGHADQAFAAFGADR